MDRLEKSLIDLRNEIFIPEKTKTTVEFTPTIVVFFAVIFLLLAFLKPSLVRNKEKSISYVKVSLYSVLLTIPYIVWYFYAKK
jgi:hypothetical protein